MDGERRLERLLASYPRTRPELPPRHRESYVEHYRENRAGERGLLRIVARLEAWMHRRMARGGVTGSILEIGAGNLNHLRYHPDAVSYDAIEPFRELWEGSAERWRIGHMFTDIAEVPEERRYDCIVSVAVLEHLTDLPLILARSGLLLKEGGSLRAGFPSEGGLLWGLAWRLTTGLKYRWQRGLDYGAIMRHEHVNTADEILDLLRYFYTTVEVARFPLPWGSLSFYTAAVASGPRLDRCRALWTARGERRPGNQVPV
jgi:SAM-dependent methyltransferase